MRLIALVALFLAGCATAPPFDTAGLDTRLTPRQAVDNYPATADARVLWGGLLVDAVNLADATRLEILAYPLTEAQRPDTDRAPLGRFLVRKEGYLETADYRPGRLVTVSGRVSELERGRVGEADYRYPVVDPIRIEMWPRASAPREPRLHFGVGVMFGG